MADTVCTPVHVMSLRALLHRATSVPHPSAGTNVHVRRDSSSRNTVGSSVLYETPSRNIYIYIYICALEIYEIVYTKFLQEEIPKLEASNGNDLRANASFRTVNAYT